MLKINKAGFYKIDKEEVFVESEGEIILQLLTDCKINIDNKGKSVVHLINEKAESIIINCELFSELTLTLAAFSGESLSCEINAKLLDINSSINLVSAIICKNENKLLVDIEHLAKASGSTINNYGIALKDCSYDCQVIGKINKDCSDSYAYQTTGILSSGKAKKIQVLPILAMKENQIKAKHSCFIGTLALEQSYYLLSRGLNEKQISELIAKSYLRNILKEFQNEEICAQLGLQIERQVELLC